MAFEDFQENPPVIILGKDSAGNLDTDWKSIYNRTCIVDGSEATPDVFNKSIADSINRDVSLESALTYLARSASLYTTDNSKFLSHCEGSGTDVIGSKTPYTGTSSASSIFVADDKFLGAAYVQGYLENMIGVHTPTISTDHPHDNSNGWKKASIPTDWVKDSNYSIAEVGDDSDKVLKVSTEIDGQLALPSTGSIIFTTNRCVLAVNKDGQREGVSPVQPDKLSASIYLQTANNMVTTDTEVELRLRFYETDTSTDILSEVYTKLNNASEYDNLIKVENIERPKKVKVGDREVAAGYFDAVITVSFKKLSSLATFKISHLMVQDGEICTTYIPTYTISNTCQYNDIIDLESNNYTYTVLAWCKFKKYSLQSISQTDGMLVPLCISFNKIFSIGAMHLQSDGSENIKLRLVKAKQDLSQESQPVNYDTTAPVIDDEDLDAKIDEYVLTALRFTPSTEDLTKVIAEFAIVTGNKILVSSTTVLKSELSGKGTIIIGHDKYVDTVTTTYASKCDYFAGPVTEIRYDEEWINDLELYIMSLAHKPFSFKQSNDAQTTTKSKTTQETLDETRINLVPNPCGRMGLINWTSNDSNAFSVKHTDSELGNCFRFSGYPTTKKILYSDFIPVKASKTYTLRALMVSSDGSTGNAGFGLRFQDASITTFDPTADDSEDLKVYIDHTGKVKYYSGSKQSLSIYPQNAIVYMFADAESSITSMGWTKIKLEEGTSGTYFTDDSGPNYAIYY